MKRLGAVVAVAVMLAGCNSEKPKPSPDTPKTATPVPSDMVFNDFLPSTGSAGLTVKVDGGLEGGLASAGAESQEVPDSAAMKVLEPGAEPRAVRKYTFTQGRTERRVLTLRQAQSMQGQKQDQPGLVFTGDFTVKDVKAKGATFEMKLVKIDLADKDQIDPRAVQQVTQELAAFNGMAVTFEASQHGDIGELQMSGSSRMQRESAAEMLGALQVFVELLFPPLPTAAIGTGAKWEREETIKEGGGDLKQKRTLELKDLSEGGGTVVSTISRKLPRSKMNNPKLPPGSTVEMDGQGSATYSMRFDRPSTKVVAEQNQSLHIEVEQGGQRRKETIAQLAKYVMETPPGK
jgi:hypothetical protein